MRELALAIGSSGPGSEGERVGGSFRDPSGFVFARGGVIYRQVNKCYRPHYDQLMRSGLAQDLMDRGWLVRHEELAVDPVGGAAYKVLRPELIRFISYPYEWSFSQLRDAALLTLRIQQQALKLGMSLKDASAYNVQFLRGRPILIDTLSFEPSVEGRPWVAYRQFCQHFLAPLALMCYCDVRLGQLLRSLLDGVPLDLASKLLPARTRLKPTLAMHVHLHARAQKRHGGQTPAVSGRTLSRSALVGILDSLATAIQHLRWRPAGTEWIGYYDDTNYSETAMAEKERLVDQMMLRLAPTTVWDLGANVGRFSRLASAKRVDTIAFDVDAAAVETNYLRSVADGDQHLLPLVMDLTNPSASVGWAGCERRSLQERGPADLVLALALIHHLAIGNNVPLPRIADWLDQIARNVVIEFVPKTDSQVRRMLASRGDIFDGYSQQAFEAAFERRFSVEAMTQIPGTDRVLYQLRRRRP